MEKKCPVLPNSSQGSRPQIDRHGYAAQAFKTHARANYLIKSGAQNGGEAQDVEREKRPINNQATGCAAWHYL
ncbi:hypothetical protein CSE6_025_41610 [Comamonas sp. E6]|nr:hypothetical protein CSE6_025_41610 [Comamonas sp. E6]